MEVPDRSPYPPPGRVLRIATPGAARSMLGPKLENAAAPPPRPAAATAMAPGRRAG